MDAHGRVHARTLARRAALGGAAALVPPGKGVGGVLGVLYQSAELVTCAAAKRTQRARRSAEGTEGSMSIPGAQRSCVSLRANWFCAAGERGSAGDSR